MTPAQRRELNDFRAAYKNADPKTRDIIDKGRRLNQAKRQNRWLWFFVILLGALVLNHVLR